MHPDNSTNPLEGRELPQDEQSLLGDAPIPHCSLLRYQIFPIGPGRKSDKYKLMDEKHVFAKVNGILGLNVL